MADLARAALAAIAAALWIGQARAYVPSPDAGQIERATQAGKQLAIPHEGYPSKDYVLYEAKDVLSLPPENGDVDAVVVGTPIERTRHASFLHAFAGEKADAATARREANLADGWLEIVVFAHSNSRKDEDFLKQFSPAVLQLADRKLWPVSTVTSDSDLDVYPRAVKDGMRYVATITYRYNLTGIANVANLRASLAFDDASGKHFDLPVDLSRYE